MTQITKPLRELLQAHNLGGLLTPQVSEETIQEGKRILGEIPKDQTAWLLESLVKDAEDIQRRRGKCK